MPADRGAQQFPSNPNSPWLPSLCFAALIGIALVATGWALNGKYLAEKTATLLAMPLGLVWLVLAGRIVHLIVLGRLLGHKAILVLWLALWVLGTSPLTHVLTWYLESRVKTYDPDKDPPFDAVVVLGGGTSSGPWRAQADEAGDRIVLGAQLYHTGKTKQLVTTGEKMPGSSDLQKSPHEQTLELWTKLGVPREAIKTSLGHNTFEEIQHLKKIMGQLAGPRIGLLTSGTHIARAVRLARAANVEVVPIAADVKSARKSFGFLDIFPRAHSLYRLSQCQHELMARVINR